MLNDPVGKAIQIALRGLSLRQQVISHNIANVDTPGFKASDVSFETQLKRALSDANAGELPLQTTHAAHLTARRAVTESQVRPQIVRLQGTRLRSDGNNVDIDREMARLAETTLEYNTLIEALNLRLSLLKQVINEGRK